MTEPKAHYRLTSIEGMRPKGTQRPSPESMEVLRQHLEAAGVPRPKGGRPAMTERDYTNEDEQPYRPVYTAVENVIVDDFGILNVGLSDEVTEAVLTVVIGWLAERDRQVREELWDEIVPQYAHDWYWHDGGRELNPYRKEATGD